MMPDGMGASLSNPTVCWDGFFATLLFNQLYLVSSLLALSLTGGMIYLVFVASRNAMSHMSRDNSAYERFMKERGLHGPDLSDASPGAFADLTDEEKATLEKMGSRLQSDAFEGKTHHASFLITQVIGAIFGTLLSLGQDPNTVLVSSLLQNLALLGAVCLWKPSTDARENIIYRDLMAIPLWSNICGFIAVHNPHAPALPVVWFLVVILVLVPFCVVHFALADKQHRPEAWTQEAWDRDREAVKESVAKAKRKVSDTAHKMWKAACPCATNEPNREEFAGAAPLEEGDGCQQEGQ